MIRPQTLRPPNALGELSERECRLNALRATRDPAVEALRPSAG